MASRLGVDHHDERVDVVAQQVAASERGAAVDGRRGEVDDEVPDLQTRARAEVDSEQVGIEGVGQWVHGVDVGRQPARGL